MRKLACASRAILSRVYRFSYQAYCGSCPNFVALMGTSSGRRFLVCEGQREDKRIRVLPRMGFFENDVG